MAVSRFLRGRDKKTPYERQTGQSCKGLAAIVEEARALLENCMQSQRGSTAGARARVNREAPTKG